MKLGDYVRPELVETGLRAQGVEEVLTELVGPLTAAGEVADGLGLVAALTRREEVQRTALGSGVAVPHALCKELVAPIVVVGVSPEGSAFGGGDDEEPVHVFFLLLSPSDRSSAHIKLLARVARLARNPEFVDSLRACSSGAEVVDAIRAFEREHV